MTPDEQDADRRMWEPTEWLERLRFRIVDEGLGEDVDEDETGKERE